MTSPDINNFGGSGSAADEMEVSRRYQESQVNEGRSMLGRIALDNQYAIIRVPSVIATTAYGYIRGVGALIKDSI